MSRIAITKTSIDPVTSGKGKDGSIKKSSFFSGRSITFDTSPMTGQAGTIKLNRGSVIEFLNANPDPSLGKLKKGNAILGGGASDHEIQNRLLHHFEKYQELEDRGDALAIAGKSVKALHCYELAARGGNLDMIKKLLRAYPAANVQPNPDKILGILNKVIDLEFPLTTQEEKLFAAQQYLDLAKIALGGLEERKKTHGDDGMYTEFIPLYCKNVLDIRLDGNPAMKAIHDEARAIKKQVDEMTPA